MKYKVGDKVKLIRPDEYLEGSKLNHIYTIIEVAGMDSYLLDVNEGMASGWINASLRGWWYGKDDIELAAKEGEQLLFDFMRD